MPPAHEPEDEFDGMSAVGRGRRLLADAVTTRLPPPRGEVVVDTPNILGGGCPPPPWYVVVVDGPPIASRLNLCRWSRLSLKALPSKGPAIAGGALTSMLYGGMTMLYKILMN